MFGIVHADLHLLRHILKFYVYHLIISLYRLTCSLFGTDNRA
jgi:hypothetical protein